ncbi:MAG: MiaB/RimO family radical SAM methylthiotransferase, partial [Lachnospiraceae bacterium]|nr:MiaB/RimO family radical SAM methylthiotransferase [Lachnospiraceae bacterium]
MSKKTIVNPKLYEIIENAPEEEVSRQEYFIEKLRDEVEIREKRLGRKLKCMVNTFGCQMNARDSEKILGILEKAGYEEAEDEKHADFVIYNTCTVRENANNKVYGRLGYLGSLKKKNPDMIIALCGCMMQEEHVRDKIKESYRYVDLVFGTHNIFKFAELVVNSIYTNKQVMEVWDSTDKIVEELPIVRKYSFKSGINIMFGCNNFCSYCIVPYVRGRERSRKPEDIINEIKTLVNDGVTEIMLLGQNVNSYGKGLDNPISFAELLGQITKIEGLRRIRFMTSHPK